jgi:hypothetical protein
MAKGGAKRSDPKAVASHLEERIAKGKAVFAKHKDKPHADDKRRLALKKLKRAQRGLARVRAAEKRSAEAAAKKKGGEAEAS